MAETEEIFSTPESEARLDLIRHLIENSELVPLVRGMPGIGKSLMASRLQAGAPDNWMVCHFAADSMMQPDHLLAHIARCNGLPDAKEDNIRRLVDRFETLRKRGTVPVLLIDDAQQLPPTSLITLLRLYERQIEGAPLVSLVLFGNEQIDMLLSTPQLQVMSPQSIQVIDLPPLTREEADAYMRHLLKTEGLAQDLALEPGRLDRLYRETGGAPGPLATAILQALGESHGEPEQLFGKAGKSWLWAAIPLGVVVLLLLLFQGPINRWFSPEPPVPEETLVQEEAVSRDPPAEEMVEPKLVEAGKTVEDTGAKTRPPVMPTEPVSRIAESDATLPEPALATVEELTAQAEDAPPQSTETRTVREEKSIAEPATAAESETPEPPAEVVPSAESEPRGIEASPKESTVAELAEVAPPKPVEEVPAVAQPPAAVKRSKLLKSAEWLRAQAPGSYTLQLLAVENVESLQPVIEKHNLQERAFSVRTERRGRPWYPLLWGQFPDRETATEAAKSLTPELRKGGAWARPLSSLLP